MRICVRRFHTIDSIPTRAEMEEALERFPSLATIDAKTEGDPTYVYDSQKEWHSHFYLQGTKISVSCVTTRFRRWYYFVVQSARQRKETYTDGDYSKPIHIFVDKVEENERKNLLRDLITTKQIFDAIELGEVGKKIQVFPKIK